jgi:hypothetical protein
MRAEMKVGTRAEYTCGQVGVIESGVANAGCEEADKEIIQVI